jgi:hypothetical protein
VGNKRFKSLVVLYQKPSTNPEGLILSKLLA